MNHRNVIRCSAALLAAFALGCSNNEPTSVDPASVLAVTPLYIGLDPGATQQLNATIGGNAVPVTWESSAPAVASVSATGLVSALTPGFAAVTAKLSADPAQLVSSNITVLPLLGIGLTNNVGVVISSSGPRFSTVLYRLFVPPGKTNVTFTFTGGTGDGDIYVARSVPPTVNPTTGAVTGATCASENGANAETCSINNPASGTWYVRVAVWDPYTGATLKGVYTP